MTIASNHDNRTALFKELFHLILTLLSKDFILQVHPVHTKGFGLLQYLLKSRLLGKARGSTGSAINGGGDVAPINRPTAIVLNHLNGMAVQELTRIVQQLGRLEIVKSNCFCCRYWKVRARRCFFFLLVVVVEMVAAGVVQELVKQHGTGGGGGR